ncbi:DUF6544 family protein [Parasphingorhabdus sp.]|uniref:DUF6544 family protein n=1 Tax=Parasphingorhabdus sp. TaxID=2709688 RepID=UPI003D2AAD29
MIWYLIICIILIAIAGLSIWRALDKQADKDIWADLVARAPQYAELFDLSMVANLPEPAQRYFAYSIAPGTPLWTVAEIAMTGQIGLGSKASPKYRAMVGDELLAPPWGFIWKVKAGCISGSDAATSETSWTRFWLFGMIPIIHVQGDPDHQRSAFGRVVSEAAFWAPASLLPRKNICWEAIDENSARAIVTHDGLRQAVEITVAANGEPSHVLIQRWSNVNSDKQFREQPFGGHISNFRAFDGYRLPTHVEGGNHIGTQDYFPFFIANVTSVRFPQKQV